MQNLYGIGMELMQKHVEISVELVRDLCGIIAQYWWKLCAIGVEIMQLSAN